MVGENCLSLMGEVTGEDFHHWMLYVLFVS